MFWTPPNWTGLLAAATLLALVLAVAPFVTPRGQFGLFPNQVATCDRTMSCDTDLYD